MVFRFLGMFVAIGTGLYGLRSAFGFSAPWSYLVGALSIAFGIMVWRFFHNLAHRGVRLWVLQKGRVQKRKLARAMLAAAVKR
jgi:hypothetical protein